MRLLILLTALVVAGCAQQPVEEVRFPKVVFIIVDGVPADVIESTPTPNLDAISKGHGYTRSYVGGTPGHESESPTVSSVGYASLVTGTWSYKHNVWDNEIAAPNYSYWDIFRIARAHDPSIRTAIFSTWQDNRTRLLGDGLEIAGGRKFDYHFDGFELDTERFPHDEAAHYIRDIDNLVADEAARYIGTSAPDLSWVYLQYTDDIAHEFGDSPEMTSAVREKDEQVGRIWAAVQDRQVMHDEDWLMVVTTDHGRDVQTGKDHGGQSDRERTTWIVTNSDNLNARFGELPAIVDILPSIATHLILEMPEDIENQLDGRSFID